MAKLPPKPKKDKTISREELLNLDKDELVDKIIQLQAHTEQLKNIIAKNVNDNSETENHRSSQKKFDFDKCHFRKVLLRVMYFGWNYQGLAVQEDTNQTIEHHLFHALKKACLIKERESSQYHRCGRTDKGVSSFGQVISINIRSKFTPENQYDSHSIVNELPYCKILNRLLPEDIRIVAWMPVPLDKPEYSARFDCKKRKYKYYFPRAELDIAAMREAASHLVGSHDFRNLCKMDVGNGVTEFVREVLAAEIVEVGSGESGPMEMYCFIIEGNAFLWHQIRCIMGVLILVGQGKERPDVVKELLDVETCPRKPHYNMALDVPLNLYRCHFELEETQEWVYDREALGSLLRHLQYMWTVQNVKAIMIKEAIQELEEIYKRLCATEKEENENGKGYSNCLLQGLISRQYTPLLKRQKCSSLEERVEYFRNKRTKYKCDDEEASPS